MKRLGLTSSISSWIGWSEMEINACNVSPVGRGIVKLVPPRKIPHHPTAQKLIKKTCKVDFYNKQIITILFCISKFTIGRWIVISYPFPAATWCASPWLKINGPPPTAAPLSTDGRENSCNVYPVGHFSWLPTIRCIRGPECSRSDAATLCFKPKSNTEPRVYCRCAPGNDSQKHRHRNHHITFLFTFFHFYVYS